MNDLHFEVLDLQTVSELHQHLFVDYRVRITMCSNNSLYVQRPYARSMVSFPVMFCVFVIYFVLLYIVRVSPNERTRHFVEYTENGFAVLFNSLA